MTVPFPVKRQEHLLLENAIDLCHRLADSMGRGRWNNQIVRL